MTGADVITIERLKHARAVVAEVIVRHGDAALPIFERLEREIAARDRREALLARVRAVAAGGESVSA
ncbi:MAG TPA: hypothetical protein VHG92_02775 [Afifellaceae bacterium]|nr:hypothetical protein [Afifellaceae bacterium]